MTLFFCGMHHPCDAAEAVRFSRRVNTMLAGKVAA